MKKKLILLMPLAFILAPLLVSAQIENPLKCDNLECIIIGVSRIILGMISLITVSVFIWGGVTMIISGGNAEKVKKAKDALFWSIIGIIIIILSWSIIQFIMISIATTPAIEN